MNLPNGLADLESALAGDEVRRGLVRSITRLTRSEEEAEDLVQEAMLRLVQRGVDLSRPVGPWLLVVARRLALDRLRARRPVDPVDELPSTDPLPDERRAEREAWSAATRRLGALGDDQRAILLARDLQDDDVAEVASRTGLSPGAVRMAHLRARERLAEGVDGDSAWVGALTELAPAAREVLWSAVLADDPARFVVRWRRGQQRSRRDDLTEARADLEQALTEADPEVAGEVWLSLGVVRASQGDLVESTEALDQAAAALRRKRRRNPLQRTLAHRGWVHGERGDFARAEHDLREALAIAKTTGEEQLARHHLSVVAWNSGRSGEAEVQAEGALALARSLGYTRGEGSALAGVALAKAERGELAEGARLLVASLELLAGERHQAAVVRGNYAVVLHRAGRVSEAAEQQLRALAAHREVGDQRSIAIAWANLGVIELDRGRVSAGRHGLRLATDIARRTSFPRLWRFAAAHLAASWEAPIAEPLLDDVVAQLGDDPRLAAMIDVLRGRAEPPSAEGPGFSEAVIAGRVIRARRAGGRSG